MFVLVGLLTVILSTVYYLFTKNYGYWKKKNVPHPKPVPLLGNYGDYILMKKNFGMIVEDICHLFPKEPFIGTYFGTEPALIVKDPEIIKLVVTKDFYYFNSREITGFADKEPSTQNIFNDSGDNWKVARQNLTPVFSSAKMKNMFYLIQSCNDELEKFLDRETNLSQVQEVRTFIGRYTMDCISTCVFGINANTMGSDENNPFRNVASSLVDTSYLRTLKVYGRLLWPRIFYALGLRAIPAEIDVFFKSLLNNVFMERNNKPSKRNDFVDFLLGFNEKGYIAGDSIKVSKKGNKDEAQKVHIKVDNDLLAGQSLVFFAAGYETSALTVSYTLFELAKHPQVQDRVIEEIDAFLQRHDNKVTYECTTELPYLEACLDETLRKYPVLGTITREVVEDYTLPSGLVLDKGLRVHLPVYYLHYNEEYFPEPNEYRPERFLAENKDNINPYTYLPFGEGPRICIGMRFAKMQMLSGLVTLFKLYRFELADGMPRTVTYEPKAFTTLSVSGINLKYIKRKK